jgi:hypothetical protein
MAKRMSAIDMESRIEVAKNQKAAKQAELEAKKEVENSDSDNDNQISDLGMIDYTNMKYVDGLESDND